MVKIHEPDGSSAGVRCSIAGMKRWTPLLLLVSVCACVSGPSSMMYGAEPSRGGFEQSLDSASSACRQNPAYCTTMAGEETVVPVLEQTRSEPLEATKHDGDKGKSKEKAAGRPRTEAGARTQKEIDDECNERFTQCLETATQSKRGPLFKHSYCFSCRDECVRQKGIWPAEFDGKPCL